MEVVPLNPPTESAIRFEKYSMFINGSMNTYRNVFNQFIDNNQLSFTVNFQDKRRILTFTKSKFLQLFFDIIANIANCSWVTLFKFHTLTLYIKAKILKIYQLTIISVHTKSFGVSWQELMMQTKSIYRKFIFSASPQNDA